MSCVYGLVSTKEPKRVRYIGISKYETPDNRLAVHISVARNNARLQHLPLYKWINKHHADGYSIAYVLLETGLSWEEACFLEVSHIRDYRLAESELLNMTDGGEGFVGGTHSEETRQKMRDYWTDERRQQQRERMSLRDPYIFTEQDYQKMSSLAKARHQSYRDSGLTWGIDVGPKDKTPKEVKDRIVSERNLGMSYREIAKGLNDDQVATANGGKWYATSVKNVFDRQSV